MRKNELYFNKSFRDLVIWSTFSPAILSLLKEDADRTDGREKGSTPFIDYRDQVDWRSISDIWLLEEL